MSSAATVVPQTHENVHVSARLVLTAATIGLAVMSGTEIASPLRPFLAVIFFAGVPGAAVVRWLRPLTATATIAILIASSLSLNVAAATVAVWTHTFHPFGLLFVVGAVSLYGLWRPKFPPAESDGS